MAAKKRKKRRKAPVSAQPPLAHISASRGRLTSVIVSVFDQPDYTKLCIDSLLPHTPAGQFELIVIDNGSGPQTQAYLKDLPATVVRFETNRGIAPAWNAGIAQARGDYLAFVDNDVLFSAGWLEGMLKALGERDIWAVVPNMTEVFVPYDFGRRAPDMLSQPLMTTDDVLVGSFFVMPRYVIEQVGEFDEEFGIGPYADLDFGFRLMEKGKKVRRVYNVCVHHFEGRTVTHIPHFFHECEERNRTHFQQKWRLDEPLPPMSADFEFELWLKKMRMLPPPDVEEIGRRARSEGSEDPGRPPRIIACVNIFNDLEVLPQCLESIADVDEICVVDGAYAAFEHETPCSTDGTLEYVRELAQRDPRIRLVTRDGPWPDEATKRSAYFTGTDGDWYLVVDADERLTTTERTGGAVERLRDHLRSCTLDAHWLTRLEPDGELQSYPRLFRHRDGIRTEAAHWNVVVGGRSAAADWSAPLPVAGVMILHARQERPATRIGAQDAYYKRMHAQEAAAFERRVAEIEKGLTGDARADAEKLEFLWTYHSNALYQHKFHEGQE